MRKTKWDQQNETKNGRNTEKKDSHRWENEPNNCRFDCHEKTLEQHWTHMGGRGEGVGAAGTHHNQLLKRLKAVNRVTGTAKTTPGEEGQTAFTLKNVNSAT